MKIAELQLPKNSWELIVSTADKHELGSDLVDLVQTAYSRTPGGSFVNSLKDVIPSDWNVIDWDKDPGVDATVFYRKPRAGEMWTGHKIQGIGHDGSGGSKDRAIKKIHDLLNKDGWWIESSDAMRHVLNKMGTPYVSDVQVLQRLFNDPELSMIDDMTYSRILPTGQSIKETVFGKPVLR